MNSGKPSKIPLRKNVGHRGDINRCWYLVTSGRRTPEGGRREKPNDWLKTKVYGIIKSKEVWNSSYIIFFLILFPSICTFKSTHIIYIEGNKIIKYIKIK